MAENVQELVNPLGEDVRIVIVSQDSHPVLKIEGVHQGLGSGKRLLYGVFDDFVVDVGRVEGGDGNQVMCAHDVHFQPLHAFEQLAGVGFSIKDLPHEMLAQDFQDFFLVQAVRKGCAAGGFVFFDLGGHFFDDLDEVRLPDRFEQILVYAEGDGFLRGFKISKAADDDDFQPGHHGFAVFDEVKAIQEGHADVGEENVGHQVLHHCKRHFAVGGLSAQGIGTGHFFDDVAYALPDEQFVFYDKNLIHRWWLLPDDYFIIIFGAWGWDLGLEAGGW